eukprot:scaffold3199_cov113-Isochrysis_galbana.AAC.3
MRRRVLRICIELGLRPTLAGGKMHPGPPIDDAAGGWSGPRGSGEAACLQPSLACPVWPSRGSFRSLRPPAPATLRFGRRTLASTRRSLPPLFRAPDCPESSPASPSSGQPTFEIPPPPAYPPLTSPAHLPRVLPPVQAT